MTKNLDLLFEKALKKQNLAPKEKFDKERATKRSERNGRKAAEKTRARKRDTRRKILLGAYLLEKGKGDGALEKIL